MGIELEPAWCDEILIQLFTDFHLCELTILCILCISPPLELRGMVSYLRIAPVGNSRRSMALLRGPPQSQGLVGEEFLRHGEAGCEQGKSRYV